MKLEQFIELTFKALHFVFHVAIFSYSHPEGVLKFRIALCLLANPEERISWFSRCVNAKDIDFQF